MFDQKKKKVVDPRANNTGAVSDIQDLGHLKPRIEDLMKKANQVKGKNIRHIQAKRVRACDC